MTTIKTNLGLNVPAVSLEIEIHLTARIFMQMVNKLCCNQEILNQFSQTDVQQINKLQKEIERQICGIS